MYFKKIWNGYLWASSACLTGHHQNINDQQPTKKRHNIKHNPKNNNNRNNKYFAIAIQPKLQCKARWSVFMDMHVEKSFEWWSSWALLRIFIYWDRLVKKD